MSERTEQLRRNLEIALDELLRKKSTIKDLEIAFQEEIENVYTDVPWWKVTNYWDIFNALFFENKSAEEVIDIIVSKAEEYENKEKNSTKNESIKKSKSLKESVAGKYSERIWDALEDGALSYQEVAEAAIYYLSDDDVEDLARSNDWVFIFEDPEEEDEEEDLDGYFKESKSKAKKESKKVLERIKPSLKSKKIIKEGYKLTIDFSDYKPWSGAIETYERIEREGKLDDLEQLLIEVFPEGMTDTGLNYLLWFDWEWVYEQLDIHEEELEESKKHKCIKLNKKIKSKRGLKESSIGNELAKYQRWVDYDMKRYGEISDKTKEELKDAGLELVKDQYGDYEVIAKDK